MKNILKYRELLIYFGITVAGFILYLLSIYFKFELFKTFWNLWTAVDSSFAVALGILAFRVYKDMAKEEDIIELKFKIDDNEPIPTGLSLLRKHFTRSEIMGVLGMIQKDQNKRYKLDFFQNKQVLDKIHKIQKGKDKEFIITMDKKEAEQFEL